MSQCGCQSLVLMYSSLVSCAESFVDIIKDFVDVNRDQVLFNRMSLAVGFESVACHVCIHSHSYGTGRTKIVRANYVFRVSGEQKFGVFLNSVLSREFSLIFANSLYIFILKGSFVEQADVGWMKVGDLCSVLKDELFFVPEPSQKIPGTFLYF